MELLKPSLVNSAPSSPLNFLERTATIYGDCVSIVYNNLSYTWLETHQRCLRVASSLVSLGIERGNVVSVLAPNIPAMYELHFAVPMSGAILNTINTRLDAHTISVLLHHGESKLVFVDCQLTSLILEALSFFPQTSRKPTLVFIADDSLPSDRNPTVDFLCTYESLVEKGDSDFKWVCPSSEWDPLVLNYTSGTTSSPKGVVHYHRAIYMVTLESLIEWSVPKNPVYLWTLPMFHANGWNYPFGICAVGGTNICLRKFDGAKIYEFIGRYNVTHMCAAPVVLSMLINSNENKPIDHPVHVLASGAPPPASVISKTESLGFRVTHVYGMTELGGSVVWCTWKKQWDRLSESEKGRLKARQGVRTLSAASEVDVVERDTGVSVRRDGLTMGEIVVRGTCVMLGYLKDPEETAKCVKNGYFYTGDVGVMYPDGYLEIKDRSKDIIISGGENVSSVEVESVLYGHPMVAEVAVVARPDDFWGETPCAFVCLKTDLPLDKEVKPTEEGMIRFCRGRLPHFMAPKTVVFIDELPKTATGKIKKFELREIAKTLGLSSPSVVSRL